MRTLVEQIERQIDTINNHIERGNKVSNSKSHKLRIRFDSLKEQMIVNRQWCTFCNNRGWCNSTNFGDLFA